VPIGLTITALAVAIVALVLYILQMILGSPKIKLNFDVRELEGARVLECRIRNEPIVTGLPYLLRIRRAAVEVEALCTITEQGSDLVLFPSIFPYLVTPTGVKNTQRTILSASNVPVSFGIVTATYGSHKVEVFDQNVGIEHGAYSVRVELITEGRLIVERANFVVSDKHPFAHWS